MPLGRITKYELKSEHTREKQNKNGQKEKQTFHSSHRTDDINVLAYTRFCYLVHTSVAVAAIRMLSDLIDKIDK